MPRYDYRCDACAATYELQQSFSAASTHTCEQCGEGTARRRISAPKIVFKGSGFYATDSRKSSSAEVGDGKPASTPVGSTADKGDQKSEGSSSSEKKQRDSSSSSSSSSTPAAEAAS